MITPTPRAQRSVFATRASATSPTACRLLALTLSGVSSGVCQCGVVEVHHVDGADPARLQRQVVVGDGPSHGRNEHVAVARLPGHRPDEVHHLRGAGQRVALLVDLEVGVAHHVEEHGVERRRAGGGMVGVVLRAEEDVHLVVEHAVVLAVHEEEVHPHGRRRLAERRRHPEQDRRPRGAVVGARDGHGAVAAVGPVGAGPCVPVRQEEEALAGRRVEARHEIPQRDRVAPRRHVGPALDDQGVGQRAKQAVEPGGLGGVPGRARNARAEGHLRFHGAVGGLAVEGPRRAARWRRRGSGPPRRRARGKRASVVSGEQGELEGEAERSAVPSCGSAGGRR